MTRFALILVILALIPFAVYWIRRGVMADEYGSGAGVITVPTRRLALYSLILIVVVMGLFVVFDRGGSSRDGAYVPPRLENGEVVSGHFEDRVEDSNVEDEPAEGDSPPSP